MAARPPAPRRRRSGPPAPRLRLSHALLCSRLRLRLLIRDLVSGLFAIVSRGPLARFGHRCSRPSGVFQPRLARSACCRVLRSAIQLEHVVAERDRLRRLREPFAVCEHPVGQLHCRESPSRPASPGGGRPRARRPSRPRTARASRLPPSRSSTVRSGHSAAVRASSAASAARSPSGSRAGPLEVLVEHRAVHPRDVAGRVQHVGPRRLLYAHRFRSLLPCYRRAGVVLLPLRNAGRAARSRARALRTPLPTRCCASVGSIRMSLDRAAQAWADHASGRRLGSWPPGVGPAARRRPLRGSGLPSLVARLWQRPSHRLGLVFASSGLRLPAT